MINLIIKTGEFYYKNTRMINLIPKNTYFYYKTTPAAQRALPSEYPICISCNKSNHFSESDSSFVCFVIKFTGFDNKIHHLFMCFSIKRDKIDHFVAKKLP